MAGLFPGAMDPGRGGRGKLGGLDGSSSESLLEHDSATLTSLDSGGLGGSHGAGLAALPASMQLAAAGVGGGAAALPHLHQPVGPGAGLGSSGSLLNLQAMQSGLGMPGVGGLGAYDPVALGPAQYGGGGLMLGGGLMPHGGPPPAPAPPAMGPPRPIKLGRGVADPAAYAHKLFIGQVPYEATEQDLWVLFSPLGDILELAILRSQGRSKGCAFLTYATQEQAGAAVAAFAGRPIGNGKKLVVKFADQRA